MLIDSRLVMQSVEINSTSLLKYTINIDWLKIKFISTIIRTKSVDYIATDFNITLSYYWKPVA